MAVHDRVLRPDTERTTVATTKCTTGGCKLDGSRRTPGAGLSRLSSRKAPLGQPAFQPYWGKLAVRNDRGDRGNVGIIRSPIRASILPDPTIMMGIVDPVGSGYVESLARPGGNVTGLATSSDDTAPKQLELLAEIVPKPSRIAVLGNPNATDYAAVVRIVQAAAQKAGLVIVPMEARNLPEIEAAFAAIAR